MMMKIVADDKIPFLKGVLEQYADVKYLPGKLIDKAAVKDADAMLIRTRTKCNPELLTGTSVKFIGTATIGFDHIDTNFCKAQGITWTNAPGCNSSSVQQYIASVLLKMSSEYKFDLREKTIGIIGVGNVGKKVEKLANALGMKILLNDPPRARVEGNQNFVGLTALLTKADIVTLHVPLKIVGRDKTYHLMNDKTFKRMRKGSWFINASRGEVTKTNDIKEVLKSGKLAGAVIDVWENEPDIDLDLMGRTYISTPHIAGYSTDGKANGTAMVVNALAKHFNLPLHDWFPDNVPCPPGTTIMFDANDMTDMEIIRQVVLKTYDVSDDDVKLRFYPSDFEKMRGDYPLRREFTTYTVDVNNLKPGVAKILRKLGFKVK